MTAPRRTTTCARRSSRCSRASGARTPAWRRGAPMGANFTQKRSHRLMAWTVPASRTRRGSDAAAALDGQGACARPSRGEVAPQDLREGDGVGGDHGGGVVAGPRASSASRRSRGPGTRARPGGPRGRHRGCPRAGVEHGGQGQHHRVGAERGVTRRERGAAAPATERKHHGPQVVAPWRQPVDARAGGRRPAWCARPPAPPPAGAGAEPAFRRSCPSPARRSPKRLGPSSSSRTTSSAQRVPTMSSPRAMPQDPRIRAALPSIAQLTPSVTL